MGKWDGKVAVITGGTSGIGLATAKVFVAEGAYVFITGRRRKELDAAAAEIGRNVSAIQGDVSKLADLDRHRSSARRGLPAAACTARPRRPCAPSRALGPRTSRAARFG
jgi:NAD(P)-dependent dehydrogenase (short-subunit alcohol dehydrogenase family)